MAHALRLQTGELFVASQYLHVIEPNRDDFDRITDGIAAERQIKGWSRAKKEALLNSDWTKVSELSRRRGGLPRQS